MSNFFTVSSGLGIADARARELMDLREYLSKPFYDQVDVLNRIVNRCRNDKELIFVGYNVCQFFNELRKNQHEVDETHSNGDERFCLYK